MKILLAVDELERSRHAVEWVAQIAEPDARVTVLTVVPPLVSPPRLAGADTPWLGPHAGTAVWEGPLAHEDVVARAQARLREHGVEAAAKVVHGDPVEEVVKEAAAGDYDLVVLGSRSSGLCGTVSSRIAERCACPTEIVGERYLVRVAPRG